MLTINSHGGNLSVLVGDTNSVLAESLPDGAFLARSDRTEQGTAISILERPSASQGQRSVVAHIAASLNIARLTVKTGQEGTITLGGVSCEEASLNAQQGRIVLNGANIGRLVINTAGQVFMSPDTMIKTTILNGNLVHAAEHFDRLPNA